MSQQIILDASVFVALIDRRDSYHNWAVRELAKISPPLLTCEAAITETCFLLQRIPSSKEIIFSFIDKGVVQIPFHLNEENQTIEKLLVRYQNVPMSLADACLVRMSEIYDNSAILTLDSDFNIYRKCRNEQIPIIMPDL
ncbi:MAG: pilus assembly protein [Pseudanabaena sp.]|nr:MAG: pilus assembly protein [Pseudanabaena sp.]